MNNLATSFLIWSSLFLQVTRTCMKAWMSSNFGKFATELRPLINIRIETKFCIFIRPKKRVLVSDNPQVSQPPPYSNFFSLILPLIKYPTFHKPTRTILPVQFMYINAKIEMEMMLSGVNCFLHSLKHIRKTASILKRLRFVSKMLCENGVCKTLRGGIKKFVH